MAEGDALPLILDTDVGLDVDDAIALCYAALEPRIDLRAVTTVYGDTQQRACVARALLRLCGREDVAVGAGAALPLDGRAHALMPVGHVDTDEVHPNDEFEEWRWVAHFDDVGGPPNVAQLGRIALAARPRG